MTEVAAEWRTEQILQLLPTAKSQSSDYESNQVNYLLEIHSSEDNRIHSLCTTSSIMSSMQ